MNYWPYSAEPNIRWQILIGLGNARLIHDQRVYYTTSDIIIVIGQRAEFKLSTRFLKFVHHFPLSPQVVPQFFVISMATSA
jgi:hypothetical protein